MTTPAFSPFLHEPVPPTTLVEMLALRARKHPDRVAYVFLVDGENEQISITYGQLERRCRALGRMLIEMGMSGERALLLFPSGFDYITAFFGCLYAGVIAVPAYPPRLNKPTPRLQAIVADARARLVLSTTTIQTNLEARFQQFPDLAALRWLAVDPVGEERAEEWRDPGVGKDSLAFLQYTSGSTSTPRGVMVTHDNLMYNSALICRGFGLDEQWIGVTWLPLYHDMGLIGAIIQTVFSGDTTYVMSPVAFLQRPFRWLQAVSRHRGALTGGPNFAYELCIHRISAEQRATLDLSCLQVAASGAEPVRKETIDRFSETFASCGFRKEAFYPCYGLAEGTLIASGGTKTAPPVYFHIQEKALEQNRIVPVSPDDPAAHVFVGCGQDLPGQKIAIVDPETRLLCPPDRIGEIWIKGPSIAQGYWNRPEVSEQIFRARLADSGDGPYLRTGDLGFLNVGEVYIAGRKKDLIIIRGRNHYPQDIEYTVETSHPALRPTCAAAFSVEAANEERLVVVQEVERPHKLDADAVITAIRQAVAREHELEVHAVVLLKPGGIPKTSSGKIQRHACRQGYLGGTLDAVAQWVQPLSDDSAAPVTDEAIQVFATRQSKAGPTPPSDAVQAWLVTKLSGYMHIPPQDIDVRKSFAEFGLSSVQAVTLSGELEEWLKCRLSPTVIFEYPTIEALAAYLSGEQKAAVETAETTRRDSVDEPIAIIGMACRFPGAASPEEFWQLLRNGVDAIREVPSSRWNIDEYYDANPATPGKMNTRWGGFLDGIDEFDSPFFAITPREAVRMDPQQRLLLEVVWEALEDAGLSTERIAGSRAGVFVGICANEYGVMQFRDPKMSDPYAGSGNALSIAANRLSYLLDLHGPSMAIDTACSSSLVAVHLACRSLRSGECPVALAAGVNLILAPSLTVNFSKAGFMASDGRCKAFDAKANGYVRSEGAGVVVLKPLSKAQADGDPIYAIIRGTAVNQDGRTNGLTAPNRHAQEAVLREAYQDARVAPAEIQYIEAHGTGTALGDPIEVGALSAVLAQNRPAERRCALASVKTNIGHLEGAAGVAGIIKVALALKHGEIPPSLHFEQPNPHIPFDQLPLRVQTNLTPWPEGRHLAGVSSFGFGGTNAHAVLEAGPQHVEVAATVPVQSNGEVVAVAEPACLLPLSARSPEALQALARTCRDHLAAAGAPAVRDFAYSMARRRTHHDHRLTIVAHSRSEAVECLDAHLQGQLRAEVSSGRRLPNRRPQVVFVFSGQGPQWFGMGRQLLAQEPVFRAVVEQCDKLLGQLVNWSLLDELNADEAHSRLEQTEVAQPVLFVLQVALASLWRAWGVLPDAVIGHSLGEVAAAHVAGALSLTDAVRVIAHRGQLMQRATGRGRTAAVEMSVSEVQQLLRGYEDRVGIAAVNTPGSVTISGDGAAVERIVQAAQARSVFAKMLPVPYAFHSPQMDAILPELAEALCDVRPSAAPVPIFSTVTGKISDGHEYDATYWTRNVRQTVRFADAVAAAVDAGHDVFVEIAPHPILSRYVSEALRLRERQGTVLASLRRGEEERGVVLRSLGALYALGVPVDWSWLYPQGNFVPLPRYPWQRERCWLEIEEATPRRSRSGAAGKSAHPLLDNHIHTAHPTPTHVWETDIEKDAPAYLTDHRLTSTVIFPGTGYLEAGLAAAAEVFDRPVALGSIEFQKAMMLPEKGARTLQVVLSPGESGGTFHVFSRTPGATDSRDGWALHATGTLRSEKADEADREQRIDLDALRSRCTEVVDPKEYYARLKARGLEYGPKFQGIACLWRRDGESLGQMRMPEGVEAEAAAHQLHPAVLDAALQLLGAAVPTDVMAAQGNQVFLPVHMDLVRVHGKPAANYWAHAVLRSDASSGDTLEGDVSLLDESGKVIAAVTGFKLRRLEPDVAGEHATKIEDFGYALQWQPQAREQTSTKTQPGTWLILLDPRGVGEALARSLESRGATCIRIAAGSTADPRQMLASAGASLRGVVHLCAVDTTSADPLAASASVLAYDSALGMVQALVAGNLAPRLCLVTAGSQSVAGEAPAVAQAPLWGLGRVVALEQQQLRCLRIDLDPHNTESQVQALCDELLADDREDQVALRGSTRHVLRLVRRPLPATETRGGGMQLPDDLPFELNIEQKGVLDHLELRPISRRPPRQGEVEVQVLAGGLNFRDVLNALGLYPGKAIRFGAECSGRITRVGQGVTDLRPGDEVVVQGPNCFASFVTIAADCVMRKPSWISFTEVATVPITFLTAHYGLNYLAHMEKGDRVLIHAAAGGVGLAAIQLAQLAGAEVFATVGSPEKKAYIESLGVKHVFSSRNTDFADRIMEITGGRGVDIVLNSLAGEFIPKSLSVLAPFGRFVEIGRIDIYRNAPIGLAPFKNNLSFFSVDLDLFSRQRMPIARRLLKELLDLFEQKKLRPLPMTVFPIEESVGAFRYMQQRKNIGKIVLTFPDRPYSEDAVAVRHPALRGDGTYLITGGLGGLGLEVAKWLVSQGARNLVLVGRRGGAAAREAVAALEAEGARVHVAAADVADRQQLAGVLADAGRSLPPIRGVIHAAGVLDDGVLAQQTPERYRTVARPKVAGAWNLHELTASLPLAFFVNFSSVAAVLGSPGQGNYAAANASLDALAQARRSRGLPALSINWGPWSDVGMAAQAARGDKLARRGMESLSPAQGVEALSRLLRQDVGAQVGVFRVSPSQWREFYQMGGSMPLLAELAKEGATVAGEGKGGQVRQDILAAPAQRRQRMVEEYLAGILGFRMDKIDVTQPLDQLGLDSLMAIELKNRVEVDLGVNLTMGHFLQMPSLQGLAGSVLSEMPAAEQAGDDAKMLEEMLKKVEQMSEEEARALLEPLPK
jgi:acyl transferase domain-containing protein/acyl-CoA synthetase (AMP-forming)/AMP-acid ligase II/NADPH:quinone reductase-like Zn-dependent oxidoreductase/NAD(P)-dependent dehydrogenase (short-subunit alcohol dehydrogenase family)/acyl carrier protein